MTDEGMITCELIFGHDQSNIEERFENGRMFCYSYSIRYDRSGKEISRTQPELLSSIGGDDGSKFTELDAISLRSA